MDRGRVADWVAGYERAWRAPGTGGLVSLFTEDAGCPDCRIIEVQFARSWRAFNDQPGQGALADLPGPVDDHYPGVQQSLKRGERSAATLVSVLPISERAFCRWN